MLRGVMLGSVSGLALSVLVVASVSLIAQAPDAGSHRPVAARPDAPVLRDQAEVELRMPDPLPQRGMPEAVGPKVDPEVADVPDAGVPAASPVAEAPAARLAEPVADAVPLPAASAFNRPREDGEVITPEADPVARPAVATDGLRPAALAPRDGPLPQTESAIRPQAARIDGFGAGPEAGEEPNLPRSAVEGAPRAFAGSAPADVTPAEDEAAFVNNTDAANGPGGNPGEMSGAQTGRAVARPAIRLVDRAGRAVPPAAIEEREAEPATSGVERPAPDPGATPRRPERDGDGNTAAERDDAAIAAVPKPGALTREAAAFDNPDDLPLLAIVLIDDADGGQGRESLAALGFPLTFAIDPTRAEAATAARAYRAAGHEVVMLSTVSDPDGAPQDIGAAIDAARAALPQALGVLDVADGDFAGNRTTLEALLPALAEAGMGLIAYPDGRNSGVAAARKAGVPAMRTYRALDDDGEQPAVIVRYLNRATFEAVRDGAVVVVGHARPETVTAIVSWRQGSRSRDVVAAPLSAVLAKFGG